MCGICGAVSLEKKGLDIRYAKPMVDVIAHRGPDDAGYFFLHSGIKHNKVTFSQNLTDRQFNYLSKKLLPIEESEAQAELNSHDWDLFLGHRRLAILDVSSAGHQPMSDLTKNIWIVFNGEVYNFPEIKEELKRSGHRFKSHTDTEVILYAYIEWGISCVEKFNGMFAFALYDNYQKKLFLARDRYGIKPLYYYLGSDNTLVFGSESKSILEYKSYTYDVDKEALLEYFTFQNIFTNKTLHEGISMLEPGHTMTVDLQARSIEKKQYWDFDFSKPEKIRDEREYIEELDRLFSQAVKRQLVSDVEVGSYLSGGIDSGAITAVAARELPYMKTFTVGFDLTSASGMELGFDERAKSEYMSYLFKTEHYEMVLKSGDMERCLPRFAYHLEEPRVGQSYPNFYAAKLASKFVKVVLSGAGGDELFGGYPWRYYRAVVNDDFEDYIDKYYGFWQRLIPNKMIHEVFSPIWGDVEHVWTRDIFRDVFKLHSEKLTDPEDYINHSLYFEAKTFLHGLLTVEDKLSMAHSLETRVPFLDNDLVDFAMKIPVSMKLGNLNEVVKINENEPGNKTQAYFEKTKDGKLLLRKMMENYVPDKVSNAVKQGFSSPDNSWFKGESMQFVQEKLLKTNARIYDYMDRSKTQTLIREHLSGERNRRLFVWSLLNFEEWCATYL